MPRGGVIEVALGKKALGLVLTVASATFVLDRVGKEAARVVLEGEPFACIVPGFLFVGHATNSAGFFEAFSGVPLAVRPLVFGLGTALFGALVVSWMIRAQRAARPGALHPELRPLALLLGGILGNGFDRVVHGTVIDCAYIVLPTRAQFNVADVAIITGIAGVAALTLLPRKQQGETRDPTSTDKQQQTETTVRQDAETAVTK